METINHEYYVSFEVAKLLEQAGFDWEVEYVYNFCKLIRSVAYPILENELAAPTLEVAQRWFREVKNIQIIVSPLAGNKKWTSLICKDFWLLHEDLDGIALTHENFDIYELALESGIKKALEIILEKGE